MHTKSLLSAIFLSGILSFSACGGDGGETEGNGGVTDTDSGSDQTNSSQSQFTLNKTTVVDNDNGLMFMNPPQDHAVRTEAVDFCSSAATGGFNDWYLPDSDVLGAFHRDMAAAGQEPLQLFDHCAAEVTADGYVRTQKGVDFYGKNPGDPINFAGGANVRCVRDI